MRLHLRMQKHLLRTCSSRDGCFHNHADHFSCLFSEMTALAPGNYSSSLPRASLLPPKYLTATASSEPKSLPPQNHFIPDDPFSCLQTKYVETRLALKESRKKSREQSRKARQLLAAVASKIEEKEEEMERVRNCAFCVEFCFSPRQSFSRLDQIVIRPWATSKILCVGGAALKENVIAIRL
jgi:hypothetical protein